ncbi:ribokinase [Bartonella sp. HY761]|uniref:ribokinase n=1 Tax=Bartonella sp. HY761 TaxID=2979330 RepID=UPI002202E91C|nr:ribokinase [Bartonella sp. HY761]UXN06492.1 ribokinase [Bartonella sp. HY761]
MTITPAVVIFGSIHYDIIVKSPDRPKKGETVAGTAWHPKCGGKGGNQAVSAANHGVKSVMIGVVASDTFGQVLKDNFNHNGVDTRWLRTIEGEGSGMSVAIFDAEGDYGAVIVSGSNLALCEDDVIAAQDVFCNGSILVLQNEIQDTANVHAAQAMHKAGGTVILNAAPARPLSSQLVKLIDILVVNTVEAEALAKCAPINSLTAALEAAKILVKDYPTVVVTAGGDGVAFACQNGETGQIPAQKVKLVSTHGAGDKFIGVLAAEIFKGASLAEAISVGNSAAALHVSQAEK